jgi:hypothetical protein
MAASFRRISVLVLLILQGSFPLNSSAQQPSAGSTGPLQLTLKEAVQLALKQNPRVLSLNCWFPKAIAIAKSREPRCFRKPTWRLPAQSISTIFRASSVRS